MKKAFITGITGFAGSHLAKHLIKIGQYKVFGTYLNEESVQNVAEIKNKINLFKLNLLEDEGIQKLINSIKPDFIFHLAALSSPSESFKNPKVTIINNIAAEINLLEAIKEENLLDAKILIISSGDIYGAVSKSNLPINEETPLKPENPYAVSKITQDFLGLQYFLSFKLKIIRVRPFNHIGPRQSPNFVVSSFAKKIAEIEKGKIDPVLHVGNLTAKRDFTDVKDMARAYSLIIEKGEAGDVYNIGTGMAYKISDILDKLLSFSNAKITIKTDESLLRPSDIPELVCDNKKFSKLTGWKPKIPIEETLKDTLDYWRNII